MLRGEHPHPIDCEIAHENDPEEPERDEIRVNKDEESQIHKHLIGERVEEGAEVGHDFIAPCPAPVDKIGHRGDDETNNRDDFRREIIEEEGDEERGDENNTEQG